MSTYENLHGRRVNVVSSNPSNPKEGEVWYNSTLGQLKGYLLGTGTWASGNNFPTPIQGSAGFGTQTAAVSGGGTPSPTLNLKTYHYDGTNWTAANDMSRASGSPYTTAYSSGSGIQTAGWVAGGGYPTAINLTENYNGTNWTASAAMPVTRGQGVASGPQTAGLYSGGTTGSPPRTNLDTVFEYDGEGWTTGGSLNTARTAAGGSGSNGSQTAALIVAGHSNPPAQTNKTEEYNGTSWSEVTNYPLTVSYLGFAGSQTAALMFGGYTVGGPDLRTTVSYDGTNWTSQANMANGRLFYQSNAGTSTAAVVFGGEDSSTGVINSVEEFTAPVETKTLTVS